MDLICDICGVEVKEPYNIGDSCLCSGTFKNKMKNYTDEHESCIFPIEYVCGHMEFRIIYGGTTLSKYIRVIELEKRKCPRCNIKEYMASSNLTRCLKATLCYYRIILNFLISKK